MKRHEKLAKRIGGLSLLVLAPVMVLMVIYQRRFDPYLLILFIAAVTLVIASRAYCELAPELKLSDEEKRKWLVDAASFYRQLGFFTEFVNLTDEELAMQLDTNYRKEMGQSLDPTQPVAELELLAFDETRVWLSDLECDVCQGNDVYAKAVRRLGEISRGLFKPTSIAESWDGEKGPIRVEFTLDGVRQVIRPKYLKDSMDTDFPFKIGNLFPKTSHKLVVRPGDPVYAIVLTDEERRWIRKRRGPIF